MCYSDYLHLINPKKLEIKDTTDIPKSVLYLDLHIELDKRDEF